MLTNNAKITSYGMDKNEENQLNQLNKFSTQASSKTPRRYTARPRICNKFEIRYGHAPIFADALCKYLRMTIPI